MSLPLVREAEPIIISPVTSLVVCTCNNMGQAADADKAPWHGWMDG